MSNLEEIHPRSRAIKTSPLFHDLCFIYIIRIHETWKRKPIIFIQKKKKTCPLSLYCSFEIEFIFEVPEGFSSLSLLPSYFLFQPYIHPWILDWQMFSFSLTFINHRCKFISLWRLSELFYVKSILLSTTFLALFFYAS